MMNNHLADIILPLAVKGKYTYLLPDELVDKTKPGCRVIVQFGNRKLYSGIVYSVYRKDGNKKAFKSIQDLLDLKPVVNETQLKFWDWLSDYYMCSIGEVMKAALPSGFCLESETLLKVNPDFRDFNLLDKFSLAVIDFIEKNSRVYLKNLPPKMYTRNTLRIVNELISKNILLTGESVVERYRPKTESYAVLSRKNTDSELHEILDNLIKAPRQFKLLSAYLEMIDYKTGSDLFPVKKAVLLQKASAQNSSLTVLVKKGIFSIIDFEVERINVKNTENKAFNTLSEIQQQSLNSIGIQFQNTDTVLLFGVTSSGKTEIYINLIEQYLKKGKQVLYLLPEITLTTQIIGRLERFFSNVIGVYHSRFSDAEKVEIWEKVAENNPDQNFRLIVGARSALFLPFSNLGLVIIDEEHDGSYKQQDPSPRYNARDSAIVLAGLHGAKTLLGSATPSIESFHNCVSGKYGLVELTRRYGNATLPEIKIANVREAYRKKQMVSHFTPELLSIMDRALKNGRQVILFQNRRGFSPYIECLDCGWIPQCKRCAVKLTYHKGSNNLVCHYCGYREIQPPVCPQCGSARISTKGFGTEKIEDEVKIIFPEVKVARLDYDTSRNKNSLWKILNQFENRQTDILVGTQMISKGLDFENLAVVGILNADHMLNFPDFRAWEKSFQLLEQVSGRAGRKLVEGEVIIQTSDPSNSIIQNVLDHDYHSMYKHQVEERKAFGYPPFTRLVRVSIKHKEWDTLNRFSGILGVLLKESFGNRVLGPEAPVITRIHSWHIKTILIKIEKEKSVSAAKGLIWRSIEKVDKMKGAGSLKISIDVDPY
jgi:primosomal protein N' (replication factor Y)